MRLLVFKDGKWTLRSDLSREAARALVLSPTPVWVRGGGSVGTGLDDLAEWLDLHPLAIEDLRNPRQRPKVEDYAGVTFIVLRVPREDDTGQLVWAQAGFFLGSGFVVSASESPLVELEPIMERLLAGRICQDGRPDRLLYHLLDALVDSYFPLLDGIEDRLEEIDDKVLDRADQATLGTIRDIKHDLARIRRVVPPMRDAVLSLERNTHPNVGDDLAVYLRDVSDHAIRLAERVEHMKELAVNAQDTWNATLANQQNQVMKRLTVVAALLLLPGLLAGLGGMNFERGFPGWGYWQVTASIFAFIVVGISVAAWRRWL